MNADNWQQKAIDEAGIAGGEYLDSIKKTDLSQLDRMEWNNFIEIICINYHDKLCVELSSWGIPF
jgi:hypothetical protein